MDISTLKNKIKIKDVPDFVIFTGPEWEVQKLYIQQFASVKEQIVKYVDSISDIYGKLKNKSFISQPTCYVVRDDKTLMNEEGLQKQIKAGLLGKNSFVLLLTTVDKRTKFYKTYKDTIIEFTPLKPAILKKYIKQHINLSDRNCDRLMEICEHDYGRILLEIDKIKRYVNYLGPAPMYDGVFEKLLKDGTIYQPPYDAVFDVVDAILDRKVSISFDLLEQAYAMGESTLVLLTVLYNNVKAVLQVQSCNSKDISKTTGLTGWQIKNALSHTGKYTIGELVNVLKLIQKVEKGIKTGTIDEKYAMEYILVNVI